MTRTLLEELHSVPLGPMWDKVNAGELWSGNVAEWPVSQVLNCRKCDDKTLGYMVLATWTEFNKQVEAGRLKCECGGSLTYGKIKLA